MALISTLVPDVRAVVPEIPSFVAERQLIRAAREFCEETRAWRVNRDLGVVANSATVTLISILPVGTELVDVISIKNRSGDSPVEPRTYSWLDKNEANWRGQTDLNAKYYVIDSNNKLRLIPTPSTTVGDKYYFRMAVKPTLSATTVDDLLVNKYDEILIHGAIGRVLAIPRKPWSDTNLAQYHLAMFAAAVPSARTEAADEFQTGIPRTVKYGGY